MPIPVLDNAVNAFLRWQVVARNRARNERLLAYLERAQIREMVVDSKLFAQAWHALPELRFSYGRCHGLKINATLVLNAAQLPAEDPLSSIHLQTFPREE